MTKKQIYFSDAELEKIHNYMDISGLVSFSAAVRSMIRALVVHEYRREMGVKIVNENAVGRVLNNET